MSGFLKKFKKKQQENKPAASALSSAFLIKKRLYIYLYNYAGEIQINGAIKDQKELIRK